MGPNVLALLPFPVNGALSLKIFRALRDRGFDITVAVCDLDSPYTRDRLDDFLADDHLIDLSRNTFGRDFEVIRSEMSRRRTQIVLQLGAARLYHQLPYWKERNHSLRIADTLYNEVGHTVNHFLYERCMDGVIVESEYMRDEVLRRTQKADPRVQVVRSGIDLGRFKQRAPAQKDRHAGLVVGYVGRMSVEKNPLGFVELAEKISDKFANVSFEMAGEGNQKPEVRRRIDASRARGRIRLHDSISSIEDLLPDFDVLVLPSKVDGRPNIVMEANACGVPVIGAPVGGVPELIRDGVNGYLLAPTATEEICALISRWEAARDALESLKASSRQLAIEEFDEKTMIDAYETAILQLAA